MTLDPSFALLTLACALLTYATRVGGYVMITRLGTLPPRVASALDAVPAAVMTTLFAPLLLAGWQEALTLSLAALAGLRLGLVPIVVLGTGFIIALRHLA